MRVLLLDIDGVLNNHDFCFVAQSCTLNRSSVLELNRIVEAVPRLAVVLSSAWRYMVAGGAMTLPGFAYLLRTHGVSRHLQLAGITPSDEELPTRGQQIQRWLDYAKEAALEVESFAILDDAPPGMCFKPVEHRLVQTDGAVGLTRVEADQVIEMLKGE